MNLPKIIKYIISEQRAFNAQKVLTDAIKNRRKISFYYNGPKRSKKNSVKPGRRILVEPIELGLTKKGNLAFKGWVQPPSVTKTGFDKHGWRTFIISRVHRLELTDDTFNEKRPGYTDSGDASFSTIYAHADFNKKSRINKYDQPTYAKLGRKPIDKTFKVASQPEITPSEPEFKPIAPEKPEIAPEKPEIAPEKPEVTSVKPEPAIRQRVQPISTVEPIKTKTGETLPVPHEKKKPSINPEDEPNGEEELNNKPLQEEITRIKRLIYNINVL